MHSITCFKWLKYSSMLQIKEMGVFFICCMNVGVIFHKEKIVAEKSKIL